MASNKTYTVMKDGDAIKELKTLSAAKKLADTEGAEVLCDGECVYLGAMVGSDDTVSELSLPESTDDAPVVETVMADKYTLTAKMNIRKAPSLNAEKLGIADKGTVVEVATIENDWMCLLDGTFILYEGGRFATKS